MRRPALLALLFACAAGLCARAGVPRPQPPRAAALQPTPRGLVIVEGHLDARAVRRAVRDAVVIHTNGKGLLDGKSGAGSVLVSRVRQTGALPTVLTDPDLTGLELRNHIDGLLNGECLHAFLPAAEAELRPDSPRMPGSGALYKETGNVGVQHARPESIVAALRAARPSDARRAEFSAELLAELGVTASFDSPNGQAASRLRHALCDALGLGRCNGKQLLRQLNRYGFTREEVNEALARIQNTEPGHVPEPGTGLEGIGGRPAALGVGPPAPSGRRAAAATAPPARSVPPPAGEQAQLQEGWGESQAQPTRAAQQPPPQPAAGPRSAIAPPFSPPVMHPAAAHQKVVTERTGSIPLQYAGPKPVELLQMYQRALSAGELGDEEEDDDGDWTEGWEEWDDEDDGDVEEDWDAGR